MNFFLVQIVCMNFFFNVKALHDFFFDSTSFNVKEMQSFAQFNYSTAEGDSLFGVLIFAKFEDRDYRERNELPVLQEFDQMRLSLHTMAES